MIPILCILSDANLPVSHHREIRIEPCHQPDKSSTWHLKILFRLFRITQLHVSYIYIFSSTLWQVMSDGNGDVIGEEIM